MCLLIYFLPKLTIPCSLESPTKIQWIPSISPTKSRVFARVYLLTIAFLSLLRRLYHLLLLSTLLASLFPSSFFSFFPFRVFLCRYLAIWVLLCLAKNNCHSWRIRVLGRVPVPAHLGSSSWIPLLVTLPTPRSLLGGSPGRLTATPCASISSSSERFSRPLLFPIRTQADPKAMALWVFIIVFSFWVCMILHFHSYFLNEYEFELAAKHMQSNHLLYEESRMCSVWL